jgi:FixJ family two-component response regulator
MKNKVLVVEDDLAVRKAIQFILEGSGHEVMMTASIPTGLALAPEADVILLDLKLGEETGDQFLEELRGRKLYTPVVVLSGVFPRAEVEDRLRKFKIVDFMEKPFKAKDLIAKVDQAAQVADSMVALSVSTDRLKAATDTLRQVAGTHITEIGKSAY